MHQVSANVAQTFAGFAARGQPGFGLPPWTQAQPLNLKIDKVGALVWFGRKNKHKTPFRKQTCFASQYSQEMSVESDYTKQYNIALEQSRNRTKT